MSENLRLLAVFDELNPAALGIKKLHEMGIQDDHINIHSGIPIKAAILGRPNPKTNVPRIGFLGCMLGMCLGLFLLQGIPLLYPLNVGGQSLFPIPPTLIITFEMTMLGMMGFSFIGMLLESRFPNFEAVDYTTEVSDGKIAVFFQCPAELQDQISSVLTKAGAQSVKPVEAQNHE